MTRTWLITTVCCFSWTALAQSDEPRENVVRVLWQNVSGSTQNKCIGRANAENHRRFKAGEEQLDSVEWTAYVNECCLKYNCKGL